MANLYVDRHISYHVNGKMQVTLHWPDTPFGHITRAEVFEQPDSWQDDNAVLTAVQAAFPDYAVQFWGEAEVEPEAAESE